MQSSIVAIFGLIFLIVRGRRQKHADTLNALTLLRAAASGHANPRNKLPSSLDHLVGEQPYQWGYRKVKRLGGLEVQDHLEFSRHLNG